MIKEKSYLMSACTYNTYTYCAILIKDVRLQIKIMQGCENILYTSVLLCLVSEVKRSPMSQKEICKNPLGKLFMLFLTIIYSCLFLVLQ